MIDITNINCISIFYFSISRLITYDRRGDGDRLVRGETGDRRRVRPLSRSLEY